MEYCPKAIDRYVQFNGKATVSVKIDLKTTHNTITNTIFCMQDERLYFKTKMKDPKNVSLY